MLFGNKVALGRHILTVDSGKIARLKLLRQKKRDFLAVRHIMVMYAKCRRHYKAGMLIEIDISLHTHPFAAQRACLCKRMA